MDSAIKLTATEITGLWGTYLEASMSFNMKKYFLQTVTCKKTKQLLQEDMKHIESFVFPEITRIFHQDKVALPHGFGDEDVNEQAPPLLSEQFIQEFMLYRSRLGMTNATSFLTNVTRTDIRDFFKKSFDHCFDQYNQLTDLLLEKGIYIRAPFIETQAQAEMISKNDYLGGVLPFTDKRPLNAPEIQGLFMHTQTNMIGIRLLTAFQQVAQDKAVQDYFKNGVKLAKEIVGFTTDTLSASDTPAPMTWDGSITSSTVAPFSDRLMMYVTNSISAVGIGAMGLSIPTAMRADIQSKYMTLMKDISQYAKQGIEIMIDYRWFEKPPTTPDRQKLKN
ncbi:DUF3231 family protein [Bacillus sp. HMF5848]|uniref:DUF3231 family protein n=1 Tax=Bacillus sp. HMF5848 TaxID=2495421 RepID=UPI000F79481E|nr:DUF3231 family protein [Bacillus sp. HMF5848]RSK28578.1 DUF3231 family protein [Bacillus sp. HMF5848]